MTRKPDATKADGQLSSSGLVAPHLRSQRPKRSDAPIHLSTWFDFRYLADRQKSFTQLRYDWKGSSCYIQGWSHFIPLLGFPTLLDLYSGSSLGSDDRGGAWRDAKLDRFAVCICGTMWYEPTGEI